MIRSTIEAAGVAHVTVRQLTHWATRGYVRPAREIGAGRTGWRYRWSEDDVADAAMLGALSHALGLGAHPTDDVMRRFALALAVSRDDDGCGILVEHGRYEVCIEVRRHEAIGRAATR
jgi:hypothetical protein